MAATAMRGAAMGTLGLGQVGAALNVSANYLDEAAALERLGYSAIWLPGGQIDDLDRLAEVAGATSAVPVGSAVISLDVYAPGAVTGLYARLEASAPGRLVVGLGGPQRPRPLAALNNYLDQLDQADPPVPAERRLVAALGPRKLELARDRSAGALMLLVTPAYTETARRILGSHSALLVDQLVTWGDADAVAARVGEQLRAGADHVVLHVLSEDGQPGAFEVAGELAGRLLG